MCEELKFLTLKSTLFEYKKTKQTNKPNENGDKEQMDGSKRSGWVTQNR